MAFDINGQYSGSLYGQDRIGQTTPDLESSEWLRPWLPVAYPAPYLPTLRQDQGHPKLASIVLGAHQLVGQDKNGGLVPAGLLCGIQPTKAAGGVYTVFVYTAADVGFAYNPQTAKYVQAAGEYALLSAPSDATVGDTITLPNGTVVTVTDTDISFAWSCDLFTAGNSGTNIGTNTTHVPLTPVAVASTTSVASTITWTFGASGDTVSGGVKFQMGTAGTPVNVTFSGVSLTNAAAAITSALSAASVSGITASHGSTTLVITGTADSSVNGTNTIIVLANDVDDVGTTGTSITYSYGVVRPIGCTVRNVYQYIGGVLVGSNLAASSSTTGINYVLDGMTPTNFPVMNYMHEMGTAIQTQFVLKLPWIGATPTTLTSLASGDGVTGYQQTFGRTFTHFTGARGNSAGNFGFGSGVAASNLGNGTDAGNFTPYNPLVHTPMDLVGRVIGIQNLNPVGYLNRVRTLFDRPMVGPMVDPNPAAIRMGGSATGGIPYHISVTTDAIFKRAYDQGTQLRPEYSTHVIVRVNL